MMKVTIDKIGDLCEDEENLVEFHTLINILNIIAGHLQLLEFDIVKTNSCTKKRLNEILEQVFSLSRKIERGIGNSELVQSYDNIKLAILEFLKDDHQNLSNEITNQGLMKLENNLVSICKIADARVKEFENRDKNQRWIIYVIPELEEQIKDVFRAVEMNSYGKYKIKFTKDDKNEEDYLIQLEIKSGNERTICLPGVFTDVFRDILMNARKYTPIGGEIYGEIIDQGDKINIRVRDNGIGIPKDEIGKAANFGYRCSNIIEKKTNGGGYGLTKAFLATQRYFGVMTIESELGCGTTINIVIPKEIEKK